MKPKFEGHSNPLTKAQPIDKAALHLVSVPIGNVKDFTLRALEVLRSVDYIACVNREITRSLLEYIDVDHRGKLIQYSEGRKEKLAEFIKSGASVAFVATQGTPGIDESGPELVREMMRHGIRVTAVPGVDACVTALSLAGAVQGVHEGFTFGGSLARTSRTERLGLLRQAQKRSAPTVFFQFPKYLVDTLIDISALMPNRRVTVLHELTKIHESVHSDTAQRLTDFYVSGPSSALTRKGQLSLVIDPAPPAVVSNIEHQNDKIPRLGSIDLSFTPPGESAEPEAVPNASGAAHVPDDWTPEKKTSSSAGEADENASSAKASQSCKSPQKRTKRSRIKRSLSKILQAEQERKKVKELAMYLKHMQDEDKPRW